MAFIPLGMLLALVAGLAGMLIPAFAGWLAWPAQFVLTYMLDIATLLSKIPHVFVQNLAFSLPQMMVFYAATAAICVVIYRKTRLKYVKVTDSNQPRTEGVVT